MLTLREKRKKLGLTAASVSDLACSTPKTISEIENGHVTASLKIRNRVESVLGTEIEWDKTKLKKKIK